MVPSSLPPLSTMILPLLVSLPLLLREESSGMVRVSPWLMVRLSSRVTSPYTVPSVPSNTMPLVLSVLPISTFGLTLTPLALIPPVLASTMALSLTVRLVVALVASYAPT